MSSVVPWTTQARFFSSIDGGVFCVTLFGKFVVIVVYIFRLYKDVQWIIVDRMLFILRPLFCRSISFFSSVGLLFLFVIPLPGISSISTQN